MVVSSVGCKCSDYSKTICGCCFLRQKQSTQKELHLAVLNRRAFLQEHMPGILEKPNVNLSYPQTRLKKTNKPLRITNSSRHLLISLTTWIICTVLLPFSTQPYRTKPLGVFFHPAILKIKHNSNSHKIKFCAISTETCQAHGSSVPRPSAGTGSTCPVWPLTRSV